MESPESVIVTDQKINLGGLTGTQKQYFFSLAAHIKLKYLESGLNRFVVGISGPSGSGKSVLSAILVELLKDQENFDCLVVDLDAFHLTQSDLSEKGLSNVKGRYDTYDIELLAQKLQSFKNKEVVVFPRYSREDHEPHHDGPVAQSENIILLLPGLWIQRNEESWKNIRDFIDYAIAIEGDQQKMRQNTINRHMRGGRTKEDAERFYARSDYINTQEILQNSAIANLTVPYFESIKSHEDINFL
jgi:pantothenate kinase